MSSSWVTRGSPPPLLDAAAVANRAHTAGQPSRPSATHTYLFLPRASCPEYSLLRCYHCIIFLLSVVDFCSSTTTFWSCEGWGSVCVKGMGATTAHRHHRRVCLFATSVKCIPRHRRRSRIIVKYASASFLICRLCVCLCVPTLLPIITNRFVPVCMRESSSYPFSILLLHRCFSFSFCRIFLCILVNNNTPHPHIVVAPRPGVFPLAVVAV